MKEFFGEDNYWQYTDGYTTLDTQIQRFLVRRSNMLIDTYLGREIIQQDHLSPMIGTLKTIRNLHINLCNTWD